MVANRNKLLQSSEWLLIATSACEQRVVARTIVAGFLKVGKRIDVETWEKERYHLVSVYEVYLKNFTCIYI